MNTTLIAGASGGIGEALATRFAERQHNLLLALTHLFLPQMQARCSGTIINVASMAALRRNRLLVARLFTLPRAVSNSVYRI